MKKGETKKETRINLEKLNEMKMSENQGVARLRSMLKFCPNCT